MSGSSDSEVLSDRERKRRPRRDSSSSNGSINSDEGAINDLPLTLTWTKVEKVKTSSGEKRHPSGTPRLSDDYRDVMEKIEEYRAIKKAKKKDPTEKETEKEPEKMSYVDQKTLTINFTSMKKNFKDVEDWLAERRETTRRSKSSIIVVEKWPEPEFIADDEGTTGTASITEKKRWHHRSRYEAVYEREFDNFDKEREMKRRMIERNRPINSNMEAIGQRIKTEHGRPQENMQRTSMDRNSRESFQRTPRRSPSREQRDSRPERKEVEHRRYDERQDGRANGYSNERGNKRQERDSYDRNSRGVDDKENIRDRSPRGYGDNGNRSPNRHSHESDRSFHKRDRSPKAQHDDRGRSPLAKELNYKSSSRDYQQRRVNDSHGYRDGGHNSSSSSRRDDYENESRRARTAGNDGYVKRE